MLAEELTYQCPMPFMGKHPTLNHPQDDELPAEHGLWIQQLVNVFNKFPRVS